MEDFAKLYRSKSRREKGRKLRSIRRLFKLKLPAEILLCLIATVVFGQEVAKLIRK